MALGRSITLAVALWTATTSSNAQDSREPADLQQPSRYVVQRLPAVLPEPEHNRPAEALGLSLAEAEATALQLNPTLAAAAADIQAARSHTWQVGRPPNPQLGYAASEVGADGTAGQQGLAAGQTFVRGGKLRLNQAVAGREVSRLEQELAVQQARVLTDLRTAFFEAYLAQRQVELTCKLVEVSRQSVEMARALLDAQQRPKTDLLQAEIEGQRAAVDLAQAENLRQAAWRRLAATMGQPVRPLATLNANLDSLRWDLSWDQSLQRLLQQSPEIAARVAAIEKARWALARQRVEPTPDVNTQLAVQYDESDDRTIAGVQVMLPIPLWDKNRGGIGRAQAEVIAAQRRLDATELDLTQRLADQFQRYQTALVRVEAIGNNVLPRAEENLSLVSQGYQASQLGFLDFLTVQRTYFRTTLEYLAALRELNRSVQLLRGSLLSGALSNPAR